MFKLEVTTGEPNLFEESDLRCQALTKAGKQCRKAAKRYYMVCDEHVMKRTFVGEHQQ
jgi:hypothetical protein